jgi:predicted secreted protein
MKKHDQVRLNSQFSRSNLLRSILLSLLMSITYGSFCLFSAETVIVNKEFNKREIKLKAGGSIRVELEELGSAGYSWKLQKLDEVYLSPPKVETKGTLPKEGITGAPVLKTWTMQTKRAGETEIRLIYYRPWEDEKTASDTFVLRVRIVP